MKNKRTIINKKQYLLFGEYYNKSIEEIIKKDPEYILYLCSTKDSKFIMTKDMEKEVLNIANEKLLKKYEK